MGPAAADDDDDDDKDDKDDDAVGVGGAPNAGGGAAASSKRRCSCDACHANAVTAECSGHERCKGTHTHHTGTRDRTRVMGRMPSKQQCIEAGRERSI